ncbi:MAG: LamG-like jellyroll fold domain-containing protein [Phycisphaeraceae bacterium JB051]
MAFPTGYTYRDRICLKETMVDTSDQTMDVVLPITALSSSLQSLMNSDGSDLRISKDDGTTRLAHDVILDASGNASELHIYGVWNYNAKTYIKVWANGTDTLEAAGSTYGQHAAYASAVAAFWPLNNDPDSDASDAILDRTSNAYHGTTNGTMTASNLLDGKIGKGLDLNGTTQYISLSNSIVTGSTVAIELWFKLDSAHTCKLFEHNSAAGYFKVGISSGVVDFNVVSSAGDKTITSGSRDNTQWTHVLAVAVENGDMKLWVNGSLVANDTCGTFSGISTYGTVIGADRRGTQSWTNGMVDEVRITHANLSTSYAKTRHNIESDVVAAWDTAVYGTDAVALGTTPIDVTIDVPDATFGSPLSGTVTLSGSPVDGATVNIFNETDGTQATETTNASGQWSHMAKLGKNYTVTFEYETGGNKYTALPHSYVET